MARPSWCDGLCFDIRIVHVFLLCKGCKEGVSLDWGRSPLVTSPARGGGGVQRCGERCVTRGLCRV